MSVDTLAELEEYVFWNSEQEKNENPRKYARIFHLRTKARTLFYKPSREIFSSQLPNSPLLLPEKLRDCLDLPNKIK